MNNAPAQNKRTIKISLDDDIRRVSVDLTNFTFSALKDIIKRLFKNLSEEDFEALLIKYQDDESDLITISSDEELTEAVSLLSPNSVLRLSISVRTQHHRCHGHGKRHWGKRFEKRGKFFYLQHQGLKLMQVGTPESIKQARANFEEQLSIFEHPTPSYNIACCEALLGNSKEAISFLKKAIDAGYSDAAHMEADSDLNSIRNLDEYKSLVASLASANPQNSCGNAQWHGHRWRRWCGGRARYFHLHRQAIKLMGSENEADVLAARALFKEQLEIANDATPLYNIACCEALLKNPSEAIEFLRKSIQAGYTNVEHLESDSDLKSLHDLEDFKEIVRSLKNPGNASSTSTTSTSATSSSATSSSATSTSATSSSDSISPSPVIPEQIPVTVSIPAVPAPVSVPQPVSDEENLRILENMGFLDRARNLEALKNSKGDLSAAVQSLLLENNTQRGFHWF